MTIHAGRRSLVGVVVAMGLVAALQVASPMSRADAAGLPAWTGGISLYRDGSFTTQRSWLWCTAAGVQIVRNIVDHTSDHTTAGQRRYFDWMRGRNRYDLPLSAGVDAAGWTAGLRHFVDDRYRLVASRSFDAALRSAVTRMRLTRLPVALTVSHGNHGWILTGFRATADPATTSDFTVTSVRVTGPLYGLQSKNGYDMPPNTKLTTAQLKRYFTPWKYAPMPMVWDGRYVSIQPVPNAAPARSAASGPRATARPTETPLASANPSPTPDPAPETATPEPDPSIESSVGAIADVEPSPRDQDALATPTGSDGGDAGLMAALLITAAALVAVVIVGSWRHRGRSAPPPA
jgi:hypothetical protein